jgi:quercetin dioxygenase-like cupin family protein
MTETKAAAYVKSFDLVAEIQHLHARRPWPKKVTSNLLLKTEDLRMLLIGMEAGGRLEEHHNDGRISIHVLEGAVQIRVQQQAQRFAVGQILALDRSIPHDLEAMEDSVLLMTIAWPSDRELAGMTHRGYGS